MEETKTRNPAGFGEQVTIAGIFLSLGLYGASFVADENLSRAIVGVSMILGQVASTAVRNWLGAPLASLFGAGPAKGTIVSLVLLLSIAPGCAWHAGTISTDGTRSDAYEGGTAEPQGAGPSEAPATFQATCKGITVAVGTASVGQGCASGGKVSDAGSKLISGLLSPLALIGKMLAGVGG